MNLSAFLKRLKRRIGVRPKQTISIPKEMDSPWLTKKEAAEYLRCSVDEIDEYRTDGILQPPIGKVGGARVLIHIQWLTACEKALRARRTGAFEAGMPETKTAGVTSPASK